MKQPSESKGEWDLYELIGIRPADEAFRPLADGACPTGRRRTDCYGPIRRAPAQQARMLAIRLPEDIERRLDALAKMTGRIPSAGGNRSAAGLRGSTIASRHYGIFCQ